MSKFFSFCQTNTKKHNLKVNDVNLVKSRHHNSDKIYHILSLLLICTIFSAGTFYIFQITSQATGGFKISAQQDKIRELKLANEKLANQVNNFEDLNHIKDQAIELGLVPVNNIEYLEVSHSGMAVR